MKLSYIGIKIFIVTIMFTALSLFLQVLPLSTAPYFEKTLFLHSSTFIYLTSVFFISYSIMQVPGGIFLDKYGIRKILPIFIGLTSIGVMLFWYSSNSYMILASRFIAGIGCSIGYIASIYVAAKFFSPRRLPMLIGIIEAASEIGTLSAANPLTYLIERFGWSL